MIRRFRAYQTLQYWNSSVPAGVEVSRGCLQDCSDDVRTRGAALNRVYLRESGTTGGMYDIMYYCHNLHFLAASYSMEGNFEHPGRRD